MEEPSEATRIGSGFVKKLIAPSRGLPLGAATSTVVAALGLTLAAIPIAPTTAADFSCGWTTGTSGTWNVASNWSTCNTTIPNNTTGPVTTYDATIAAAGTYTVTLNTDVLLNNLTINAAGATLAHTTGTLTIAPSGIITIQAGTYQLNGGTIKGGIVQETGSNGLQFTSTSSTLDGVTVRGTLDLSGTSNRVRVLNGLTLLTQAGAAPGTLNLTGNSSILSFDGALAGWTQTFDNATMTLGTTAGNQGNVTIERGGSLTLGAGAVVQGTGEFGTTVFLAAGASSLVNQGTMSANFSGRALNVGTGSAGGGVNTFTNSGVLEARNGGILTINALNWTNGGQVNVVDATSTINLGGTFTSGALGTFSNNAGGHLNLTGTLNNAASILTFGATTGTMTMAGGTIQGGTVQENGANGLRFSSSNSTLDGVTVRGTLDMSAANSRLRVLNGLTLLTEAGVAPGAINVTGTSAILSFDGALAGWTQTFGNATMTLGTAAGNSATVTLERGGTLTLGPGAVVQGSGDVGTTVFVAAGASTLINQGTMSANFSGRALNIGTGSVGSGVNTFANSGVLEARNGGILTINALNWTNGGQVNVVDATSTINLGGTFTSGALGTFSNNAGGHLNLTGTLNNAASILTFGATTGTMTMAGGTIQGGTVQENGANGLRFSSSNSTLDGVTVRGTLDMSAANSRLRVLNGLTLLTEAGVAPGAINVTGTSAILSFDGALAGWTQTFGNATMTLGTAAGNSATVTLERGGTLTLGPGAVVQGSGDVGTTVFVAAGASTLINQGTMSANFSGRALNIGTGSVGSGVNTFANSGTLEARNGGTLNINAVNWSNTGAINVVDATSTINLGGTFTSGALGTFSNNAGGALNLTGKLNNTALTFGPTTGKLTLAGGTIQGGTVQENGANGLAFSNNNNNVLDNVTLRGTLDLSAANVRTRVLNGLVLQTEAGGTPGVANVTGSGSAIQFDGAAPGWSQSFNNATINLGNAAGNLGSLTVERGGSLTLGPGAVVQGAGGVGTTINVASGGTDSLTNQGTISANLNAGTLTIGATSVGSSVTTFANSGTLEARNGGILTINAANWSNTGAINVVDAASTINLGGTFTSGGLGTFSNGAGGHLNLTGTLNNAASVLTFGPTTGKLTLAGGTIQGGTVQENGANGLAFSNNNNNVLDNVTLRGTLDLSAANVRTRVLNGLVLQTEAGGTPGVANVTGSGSAIQFDGAAPGWSQSFNNATINLGNAAGNLGSLTVERGGSLTLGPGAVVQGAGGVGTTINVASGGTDSLTNQGTISANLNAGTLTIGATSVGAGVTTFTNTGTVEARNGGTAVLQAATITNSSGGTLTGGTWSAIGSGSILNIRSTAISTNAATIVLDTTGSVWRTQDPITNVLTTIESSLTTNAAAGTLEILNNRNYTTANALSNVGALQLGGGTLTAASLTNSGQIFGFGTLANNVTNSGTVRAASGLLTASNGITGTTGTVQIDASASLTLGAASTAGTLSHNGTTLNLGANNITVSTAYTNTNFGTGNTFNNRANVTGSGQILAAGATPATAQTLSGNIVGGTTTGAAVINFGNVHVGNSVSLNYQIGNSNAGGPSLSGAIQTAVNGGNITDARLSGTGVTSSNWGPAANGATTGSLGVTFNAASSGALTGQVVHVRNNFDNTNSQNVTLQGAAYDFATVANGGITPTPVVLANQRVGGTGSQALTVTNTAPVSVFSETLTAGFGANSGNVTNNAGSITALAPGGSSTALSVGVNTSAAGAQSGTVTVNLTSNAVNNSGLGNTVLTPQTITVSGNVYQAAIGQLNAPTSLSFGTVQVGQTVAQTLSISNIATGPNGFVEDLGASFGTTSGVGASLITGTGSTGSLLAGGTDNSSLVVHVNTTAAGNVNGAIAINYTTNGTVNGVSNGLGSAAAGSSSFGVVGTIGANVVDTANPVINNSQPINLGNVRINTSSPTALVSVTNQASGNQQAALNASIAGNAPITGSGSFNLLLPGSTNNTSLQVGMNTNAAGHITGTATVSLVSDASNIGNCAPNCQLGLPSQNVNVTGNVYQVAQPTLPNSVALGNVHVGGTLSQGLTVTNTLNAPVGFQEGLNATVASTTGAATAAGSITNLAAGSSNNSGIVVGINTATAGAISGTATLGLQSNGSGTSGLSTLGLPNSAPITISGNVYNLAVGSTTPSPVTIANQRVGGSNSQVLTVANSAPAGSFTEVLNASFGANTGSATNNGGSIAGGLGSGGVVGGGSNNTAMSVGVNTTAAGARSGTVTLNYVSNGTGSSGLGNTAATVPTQTITVSGNVYQAAIGQLNAPTSLSFGTVQVGQTVAQTLSISNIATGPNGFVEDLGASFGTTSGVGASLITGTGSTGSLLAGGTDNSSLVVHVNTTAAGNVNGAIAINYTTNGTVNGVSNGLGSAAAGSSSFGVVGTIGANVVDTANPVINNSQPINLGNVRINTSSPTALVSVTNQASGNQQAALNASIAGNAPITGSGSFNLLLPGSTNNTSLQVGMNTNAAGHITGTATVSLVSDASNIGNCAPNCQLGLPSQNVNVTGNVYQVAQPTLPNSVALGNVHVGGTLSQGLTVTNTLNAPVGFQEGLNATVASTTGAATAAGSITNLAAGSSNNSGIVVGINTATAGAISGTATLGLQSNGSGTSGLSTLGLPNSAPITISGNVYNLTVGSTTPSPVTIANQRVGGSNSQVLTVANSAPAGSFTEVLNASFGANTGSATNNGGSIAGGLGSGGVVGGGSNNTAMSVGVNTTAAGARSGTVTLNYVSNGTGSSGLGNTAATVPTQTITVSGNVYQAAIGQLNAPTSLSFGTVQVGQTVAQTLSISNIATGPNGFVEDLGASFGTTSGVGASLITGTGSTGSLLAGGTDNSSLVVHVNTTAAGNVNGAIAINYTTNGTVNGVSNGLGSAAAGSSSFGVVGTIGANVVDTANPVINNSQPINLGNVRINTSSPTALVSVTNQASGNQQAALNASIAGNAPVTGSGSFNLLAPGATNNTSLQVGMNTNAAGHIAGTATVSLVSDASNIGNCAPNCQLSLPSQNVNVALDVYRLASPQLNTSALTLAGRVGGVGDSSHLTGAISISNSSPDTFTEGLTVTRGTLASVPGGGFSASGGVTNLAAQGSSSAIQVSLNTGSSGSFSGSQALNYVSTGAGTDGAPDIGVGSGSVTLNGHVYTPAAAQVNTTQPINLGIVHVGDAAPHANVSVTNTANGALNDALLLGFASASTGLTGSSNVGATGLAGGQTNSAALNVAMNTGSAGTFNGNVNFAAASHDSELTDLALSQVAVAVSGQVNNYATSAFVFGSGVGTFSHNGSIYTLDFGTVFQGSGLLDTTLFAQNGALGPADLLDGSFNFLDGMDFGESGFNPFTNLAAGQNTNALLLALNTANLGMISDDIVLDGTGHNASGYSAAVGDITLIVRANVIERNNGVPEPGTFALLALAVLLLLAAHQRHSRATQHTH